MAEEYGDYEELEEEEFNTQINRRTVRRLVGLARPHWLRLVGFFVMIALVAGADSYFTFLNKRIVDEGILAGDLGMVLRISVQYAVLSVASAGGVFGFIWLAGSLSEIVQYDLRRRMFDHLQELSFEYFDRTPVGWIMSRLTSDTGRIGDLLAWGVLDSTWFLMSVTTSMVFMLVINWKMALLVFAIVPLLVIVAARFKKKILVEYRAVRRVNSKITGAYNENISGVRVAKALVREEQNLEEFSQLTEEM
ncbi:MAG: ABC transporter transmembrane domain-containing protein, partial [Anaerolineales bacterium]